MPEKPTEKGNAYHHWLFDEINILSEILGDRLRESRIVRRSKSIDWESVTEGYNDRFNVCFQEKGVLMRDGESELREGRSAPNRTRQEIKMISSNDPRLSSIVAEYNDLKKKIDNDISEDSSQVEVYEEDQVWLPRSTSMVTDSFVNSRVPHECSNGKELDILTTTTAQRQKLTSQTRARPSLST